MARFRYKLIAVFSLIAIPAGIYGFNVWRAAEEVP